MNSIKKIPLPIAGLILSMLTLGNVAKSFGEIYRSIFGYIAIAIFILLTIKILMNIKGFVEEMQNPVIASVFCTYSMSMMLIATYLVKFSKPLSTFVWFVGLLIHIGLIMYFTKKFVLNFDIKNVFPSWFITYVGIIVATVSSGVTGQVMIGKITFWFGLVAYVVLLPIVIKKLSLDKNPPEPVRPVIAITAAPAALSLSGFMTIYAGKMIPLMFVLLAVSQLFFLFALVKVAKLIGGKFYPSFSAFTFPMIISGFSLKLSSSFMIKSGMGSPILMMLANLEILVSLVIILYVLYKYARFVVAR